MLPIAIGGSLAGYVFGWFLRRSIFSQKDGTNDGGALLLAILSWPVIGVCGAIFLETQYGITVQAAGARLGSAALFFAGGLYYGVRRKSS